MIRTTPFHARLSELNDQHLYTHWQGTLSPLRYTHAPKHEYFAVRNGVGVFDTSPLFKYRITGADAERLLMGTLTRDIRTCRPGQAMYSVWCDDRGFVMEDGVAFRHADNEFLLTTARPALGWFADLGRRLRVAIEDVSDDFGMLAVQGPRSRVLLAELADEVNGLGYFDHAPAKIGSAPVTVSRTGYTGDLGFEITVGSDDAIAVLDAVLDAGRPHSVRPFGEEALMMLRIEAGLALIDVDWHNSRTAWVDADRVTPKELGMGWMLRAIEDDTRPFIGRDAIRRELADRTSRWATTGFVVDWEAWNKLYRDAGLLPPKDPHPLPYEVMLRDGDGTEVGYATAFMYSPVLQRHIGMGRVRPGLAAPDSPVHVELTLNHHTVTVAARTARLPLFNPARKTARA